MIYLEMNHVRKSFGDLEVLKDISLKVEEGEVLSIIGPSGSGKSTLLRCAAMLETMDGGDLTYLGEQAVRLSEIEIRLCKAGRAAENSGKLWIHHLIFCNKRFNDAQAPQSFFQL